MIVKVKTREELIKSGWTQYSGFLALNDQTPIFSEKMLKFAGQNVDWNSGRQRSLSEHKTFSQLGSFTWNKSMFTAEGI
jgi:hypothetical protein